VDSCELEEILQEADRRVGAGTDSLEVVRWLRSELNARWESGRSRLLPPADTLPDPTVRLDPRRPLTPRCRALLEEDRRGFAAFTPFLWLNTPTLDGDVVFARDLRERNVLLMRQYPERAFYLYAPPTGDWGVVPEFFPLPGPGEASGAR
jgi:hypothetical protein